MHANPADRLTAFPALPQRFEQRGIFLDVRVAVHARLGGWDRSVGCIFHRVVAVPTIDSELTRMQCVGVRNGLFWHVAHICGRWTEAKGDHEDGYKERLRPRGALREGEGCSTWERRSGTGPSVPRQFW